MRCYFKNIVENKEERSIAICEVPLEREFSCFYVNKMAYSDRRRQGIVQEFNLCYGARGKSNQNLNLFQKFRNMRTVQDRKMNLC